MLLFKIDFYTRKKYELKECNLHPFEIPATFYPERFNHLKKNQGTNEKPLPIPADKSASRGL